MFLIWSFICFKKFREEHPDLENNKIIIFDSFYEVLQYCIKINFLRYLYIFVIPHYYMKIGNIEFPKYPVFLAPMEDVTDMNFRLLCKSFGADMVYTEFVSSDALIRHVNKTKEKLTICDDERPVAIQIYGREVDAMVEAAKICEESRPDILDINFGCPVKKVAGKGAGSGMMKTPDLMVDIVREVVKAVNIPVTVKTRLGWDHDSKIIVDLAEELQDVGIQALTIHGRTRCQMYTGEADWTLIGDVKNNPRMNIPIIGNGDITTPELCKQRFDETGVDAVMIGRGAIGNPWIFQDAKHYLETGNLLPEREFNWYLDILKGYIRKNIEHSEERGGIIHSRRHIAVSNLFKGIPDFKKTRVAMLKASTEAELFEIMDSIPSLYSI